jgi:hypothetical protein
VIGSAAVATRIGSRGVKVIKGLRAAGKGADALDDAADAARVAREGSRVARGADDVADGVDDAVRGARNGHAPDAPPTRNPAPGAPGSAEHKADAWARYQERDGAGWTYERWSNVYEQNMTRWTRSDQAAEEYWETIGKWGEREGTVNLPNGQTRRLDITDVAGRRGVEHKTGDQYLTADNLSELERDAMLVEDGWSIQWVFAGHVSKPLEARLRAAGIEVIKP